MNKTQNENVFFDIFTVIKCIRWVFLAILGLKWKSFLPFLLTEAFTRKVPFSGGEWTQTKTKQTEWFI